MEKVLLIPVYSTSSSLPPPFPSPSGGLLLPLRRQSVGTELAGLGEMAAARKGGRKAPPPPPPHASLRPPSLWQPPPAAVPPRRQGSLPHQSPRGPLPATNTAGDGREGGRESVGRGWLTRWMKLHITSARARQATEESATPQFARSLTLSGCACMTCARRGVEWPAVPRRRRRTYWTHQGPRHKKKPQSERERLASPFVARPFTDSRSSRTVRWPACLPGSLPD